MNDILNLIGLDNVLEILQGKSGVFVSILVTVGALRLTIKPLLSVLHSYTEKTITKVDDEFLAKVENSKVLKIIFYVLDWVSSIKIVPKNVERIDVNKMKEQEEAK
mgnify:FL=1